MKLIKFKTVAITFLTLLAFVFALTSCKTLPVVKSSEEYSGLENARGNGPAIQTPNEISTQPPAETTNKDTTITQPLETTPLYTPLEFDEVYGVWISYIELSQILNGKSEDEFRTGFKKMLENCSSLNINTVYVHLRAFGDAYYRSQIFPWSKYVSGEIGKAPDFDPLEIMLEESHKKGIAFHGWINPMRIQSDSDIENIPKGYLLNEWYNDSDKNGKYIIKHENNWYLNPAYDEVVSLIENGVREIVENYEVDGIHIDDYFYPTTDLDFDEAAYKTSSFSSLKDFRFSKCSDMVGAMYNASKTGLAGNSLPFGISPQGNINENYDALYADVKHWSTVDGYADYIAPQLYYGFENLNCPFTKTANEWQEIVSSSNKKLILGLAVYKIGEEDVWAGTENAKQEWIKGENIIKNQISEIKILKNYGGVIFYSYDFLFNPDQKNDKIDKEIQAFKPLLD